jgi:hypothetical protein
MLRDRVLVAGELCSCGQGLNGDAQCDLLLADGGYMDTILE